MSVVESEIPTFYILVEGYTDQRVLGVLLGSVGFTYAKPNRRSSDAGAAKQVTSGRPEPASVEPVRYRRGAHLIEIIKANGTKKKMAVQAAALLAETSAQRANFLIICDADDSVDDTWGILHAALCTECTVSRPQFTQPVVQHEAATEPRKVWVWFSMDAATGTGSMDTLLRTALAGTHGPFVDSAAQLDAQFSHLRGETLGGTILNNVLHDKAVVGIAHAVLDPKRQYDSAFRDSEVWKAAILNPASPFAPLLEFLRHALSDNP